METNYLGSHVCVSDVVILVGERCYTVTSSLLPKYLDKPKDALPSVVDHH
jgi:hypothetical protein